VFFSRICLQAYPSRLPSSSSYSVSTISSMFDCVMVSVIGALLLAAIVSRPMPCRAVLRFVGFSVLGVGWIGRANSIDLVS